jgi:hypothetical protein
MFGDCSIGCVSQIGANKTPDRAIATDLATQLFGTGVANRRADSASCLSPWKRRQRINAMNEKTIDQIEEEVLICEISDEAVEAAGTRTEIAGVWTFICTGIQCHQVFSRRNESPRPGRPGL